MDKTDVLLAIIALLLYIVSRKVDSIERRLRQALPTEDECEKTIKKDADQDSVEAPDCKNCGHLIGYHNYGEEDACTVRGCVCTTYVSPDLKSPRPLPLPD